MRRVTLFDIDSRIPNLPLMKLSGEKYLRWLNRRYYETFGRYYLPLSRSSIGTTTSIASTTT